MLTLQQIEAFILKFDNSLFDFLEVFYRNICRFYLNCIYQTERYGILYLNAKIKQYFINHNQKRCIPNSNLFKFTMIEELLIHHTWKYQKE